MDNRIKKILDVDWREVKDFQPENFKVPYHGEKIKQSILKYGFSVPFAVWEKDGSYYCIDGHLRREILYELQHEGFKVPSTLPAYVLECADEKEAAEMLLEVFNTKSNPINYDILEMWSDSIGFDVDFGNLHMEMDVDVVDDVKEEKEHEDKHSITLNYVEDDYHQVKDALLKIAKSPEDAVWKLCFKTEK